LTTAVSSLAFAPSLACAAVESLGRKALAIQADSADPAAVTNAVETTARTFSGLNVLVNNAGV
jgi:NAD(P)-dependent dehydrogenase (short-subunit alcohol dehydrogenase family)